MSNEKKMSENQTIERLLDEALAIFGDAMLYKVLEDGSIYFYTKEYAHKNKDIALHSPSPWNPCGQRCKASGAKEKHGDNLCESPVPRRQTDTD
mgnify:CR=1 FL=1